VVRLIAGKLCRTLTTQPELQLSNLEEIHVRCGGQEGLGPPPEVDGWRAVAAWWLFLMIPIEITADEVIVCALLRNRVFPYVQPLCCRQSEVASLGRWCGVAAYSHAWQELERPAHWREVAGRTVGQTLDGVIRFPRRAHRGSRGCRRSSAECGANIGVGAVLVSTLRRHQEWGLASRPAARYGPSNPCAPQVGRAVGHLR
jgi:hypothetical protein